MATINEMRQVATQIENETQVGGNTASRVGGLFNDVVDKLEDVDGITPFDNVPTQGSEKGVKSGGVSQVSNGLDAKCGIFRKVFSVTAGSHSSNNDRAVLNIPAGVPVILCLKNVTTSNSGNIILYALFKGDASTTQIGNISFDNPRTIIFDRDVEQLGFYWSSSVGATSGDVAFEVETFAEGREYSYNPFNIVAYISNGDDFVWTDVNASLVTINNNIIIKHLIRNHSVTIQKNNVLAAAAGVTGFSVSGDNIRFPNTGTMYYDTKTQTIGFVNNSVITDNDRYIALFESHYTSYKRGLLVDYMIAKRFNTIDVLTNGVNANTLAINNLKLENDDINLYIRPVNIRLTASAASLQYYPIVLKRGNYSIKNNGARITSFYLCSSVSGHDGNRVVTIGEISRDATVNFIVERDDIVCVDGWWPAETDFQIIYNDGISYIPDSITELQELVKTKRDFTLVGAGETFTMMQFVVNGNSKYRIIPDKVIWPVALNTASYNYLAFEVKVNDSSVYSRSIRKNTATFTALEEYIDIDIPDLGNASIVQIGIRAAAEENVSFELLDITSLIPIVNINSLFENNPDNEFEPKIRTLKKKTPYNWSPVNTPLVLLWFSDLHHALANLDRINMWKEKYSQYVDDVLNTGDTIADNLSTYDNDMNAYFEDYEGDDILFTMGNHDVTSPNSSTKAWDGTQSIVDMYEKFIGRMNISGLGITQPTGAAENGCCYYYKDYVGLGLATSSIRLIVIDSCITDTTYQASQLVWFSGVLADARTQGYPVIVASHFMPIGCNEFDNAQGFAFPFNNDVGTIIGREYRCRVTESINSDFIDAVDTHINNNGEFVCWLCGHTHADHVGVVPSHPNQLVIAVTSASNNVYAPTSVEPVRVGKSQDGFNMIEVDTYSKQVKLVRVGYNIDALGRKVDMLTIDYKNKVVLL